MSENEISRLCIGCAIKVHRNLGPGLLEAAYQECLLYELGKIGLRVEKQRAMPLVYENVKLDLGFRVDIVVEDKVLLEIKSVETLTNVHLSQVITYLKLGGWKLGLLLNFNVALLSDGIRRVVNGLDEES